MTYSVLPPEINSARMFSGAGSTPMLDAAGAWDSLAAELGSAASSFSSLTSGLTNQAWQGPASAAMAAAAAPYAGWLSAAEAQAAGAAGQARAVAAAFESALGATVHPLAVAANRNGLVQLVATNLFGQNAPAIAAVESEYEQMWAQDVAAMAGYHAGASAAATGLSPWQTLEQDLTPKNVAISVLGQPLVQLGTARAYSGWGLAVAVGANSYATTGNGFFNSAFALGAGSLAAAGGSSAPDGPGGPGGPATGLRTAPSPGSFDTAIVLGTGSTADAGPGSFNNAFVLGTGSTADAGPGSFDNAFVLGTGSTADAGFGIGANGVYSVGNTDIAAVLGNMQTATATGASRVVDIVTPFGTL